MKLTKIATVAEVAKWRKDSKYAVLYVFKEGCVACEFFLDDVEKIAEANQDMSWASFDLMNIKEPILESSVTPSLVVFKDGVRVFVGPGRVEYSQLEKAMLVVRDGGSHKLRGMLARGS